MAFSPPVICQSPQITQHSQEKVRHHLVIFMQRNKVLIEKKINNNNNKKHVAEIFLFLQATDEQISTVKTTWVSAHASPSNGRRKKKEM